MATISNSNVFCRPRANSRWDVVRLFIVFILVLSSVAKAWELVTVSNLGRGLLNDRNFILLVVIFQLTFSCWLLCNFQPRIEWLSPLALFLFFLGVVCFKIITHEKDCQCFGAIQVHPWVTFCLDVTIVLALCFSKPTHRTGKRVKFKRYAYVFLVWLLALVIIISGFFSVNRTFSSVGDLYTGIDGEQSILIKPENWDRDDLPIVPFLETPEVWNRLEPGKWVIFFFRNDCTKCKNKFAELESSNEKRVFCIEVPPSAGRIKVPEGFVYARLSPKWKWSVETPTVLEYEKTEP